MTDLILTEEEFEILCRLSKRKAKRIVKRTQYIYHKLAQDLEKNRRGILYNFRFFVFKDRDFYVEHTLKKTISSGGFVEDPYFFISHYCLTPFVYKEFNLKHISAKTFEETYRIKTLNQSFEEKYKGIRKEFLKIFYEEFLFFLEEMFKENVSLANKWILNSKGSDYAEKINVNIMDEDDFKNYIREVYPKHYQGITKRMIGRLIKKINHYLKTMLPETHLKKNDSEVQYMWKSHKNTK